eukprot:1308406-Pleurochrysis_carterae.AAC.1
MTLVALSRACSTRFSTSSRHFPCKRTVSPGDLTDVKPKASNAPPQILHLAFYAIDEHYRYVIRADAPF